MAPFNLGGWLSALQRPFAGSQAIPEQHSVDQSPAYHVENQGFQGSPIPSQHEQQFYDTYDAKSPVNSYVSPQTNAHHFDCPTSTYRNHEQHCQGSLAPRMVGNQQTQNLLSPRQDVQQHFPSNMTPQQIQQHPHNGFSPQSNIYQRFPSNAPHQQTLRQQFPGSLIAQQGFQHLSHNVPPQHNLSQHPQGAFQFQQANPQRFVRQVNPQEVSNYLTNQTFHNRSPFQAHHQAHPQVINARFFHQNVGQQPSQQHFSPQKVEQQVQQSFPSHKVEQEMQQQVTNRHAPLARPFDQTSNQNPRGDVLQDNVQHKVSGVFKDQNHNASGIFFTDTDYDYADGMHLLAGQRRYAQDHILEAQPTDFARQDAAHMDQATFIHRAEAMDEGGDHGVEDREEDGHEQDDHNNPDHIPVSQQQLAFAQEVQHVQGRETDMQMEVEEYVAEIGHHCIDGQAGQESVDHALGQHAVNQESEHLGGIQEMDPEASKQVIGHAAIDHEMGHGGVTQEVEQDANDQGIGHEVHDREMGDASASEPDGESSEEDVEEEEEEEEKSEDEEDSEDESEGPQSAPSTAQSRNTSQSASKSRSESPVGYNVTDTSELAPMIRGPDPGRDLSKLFLAYEKFHLKAFAFKPALPLASHRYWIAVLHLDKQPKAIAAERHLQWLKGNRLTTVETVWRMYQMTSMAEDFVLMLGFEGVNFKNTMEELDLFGDKFVCFQAVSKGKSASVPKSYFEEVVPKQRSVAAVVELD